MDSFKSQMGEWDSDQTKKAWLTSILPLAAWFGSLYSGFFAEIISRRYTILIHTALFCLGVLVQCLGATASGPSAILGGRFIAGLGLGALLGVVPLYVSECAPAKVRGFLVSFQELAIVSGVLLGYWVDFGINYIKNPGSKQSKAAWLIPISLQFVPGLILLVGTISMVNLYSLSTPCSLNNPRCSLFLRAG